MVLTKMKIKRKRSKFSKITLFYLEGRGHCRPQNFEGNRTCTESNPSRQKATVFICEINTTAESKHYALWTTKKIVFKFQTFNFDILHFQSPFSYMDVKCLFVNLWSASIFGLSFLANSKFTYSFCNRFSVYSIQVQVMEEIITTM